MTRSITLTTEDADRIAAMAADDIHRQYPGVDYLSTTVADAIERAISAVSGYRKMPNGEWGPK